jgi:hypothetical protein
MSNSCLYQVGVLLRTRASRRRQAADHDLGDRHVKLTPQTIQLPALLPGLLPARMCDDDHLVGAEVTQLVLDRSGRAGITDLAARHDAQLARPRQRAFQADSSLLELAVDVRDSVVQVRGQHRSEDVDLDGLVLLSEYPLL